MRRRLRILDLDVTLTGPDALVAPIAFAYRRFTSDPAVVSSTAPAESVRIELTAAGLHVDGQTHALTAGLDPRLQLYQSLLTELMQRIDTHLVLHAAALTCADGSAMLLAAPSGHGKSSQTLELVRRGAGLLSDDYAPLDPSTGLIAPYPRAVGVIPGGAARVPDAFLRAAGPDAPELFGKRLVDVGAALGESSLARGPARLGRVVLLTSGDGATAPNPTRIELATRHAAGATFERRVLEIKGVRVAGSRRQPPLHWLSLELDPSSSATAALERLLDDADVMFFEKSWTARPDFTGEPEASPISRRVAAEHLGRELLNRRPGGRLLARYGDRLASLFFELAGALRRVQCFEVRVGRFDATSSLLERIAGGALDIEPVAARTDGGT